MKNFEEILIQESGYQHTGHMMTQAYLRVLDKHGVCGTDKPEHLTQLINFLTQNNVLFNYNSAKRLVWLIGKIPDSLSQLFSTELKK